MSALARATPHSHTQKDRHPEAVGWKRCQGHRGDRHPGRDAADRARQQPLHTVRLAGHTQGQPAHSRTHTRPAAQHARSHFLSPQNPHAPGHTRSTQHAPHPTPRRQCVVPHPVMLKHHPPPRADLTHPHQTTCALPNSRRQCVVSHPVMLEHHPPPWPPPQARPCAQRPTEQPHHH